MPGYPGAATQVELDGDATHLYITVLGATGTIARTTCLVRPTPGTPTNPSWPGNCGVFTNLTPPDREPPDIREDTGFRAGGHRGTGAYDGGRRRS
ncbi:hypothetical protein ACLQ2R_18680 [Streptosporangium sp. DT93]|uniref:hypothetical protein n=1 Tax=Streptosporangium sp. DT93 TaxID=3393428 RepID=UPI003CF5FFAE